MYTSFYTAARGAIEQQKRMDVVANNLANTNNYGYKTKNAVFRDLMYYNLNNPNGEDTPMKAGAGITVDRTDTNFEKTSYLTTNGDFDFAIEDKGFFMLRSPITGEISYSRNGHFSMSQRGDEFYLVNDNGNLVLNKAGNPIRVEQYDTSAEIGPQIGVYNFEVLNGMLSIGHNEFQPVEKNGNPYLLPEAKPVDHALEGSNVDVADEVTRMIETQRAYSYALKMVQTSDEVVSTINGLRQ